MKPRTDLVAENADGELIVLDKDGGEVHQLNQSAAMIWSSLGEGMSSNEIAELLTDTFDIEHERAVVDVKAAVEQFIKLGLLEN